MKFANIEQYTRDGNYRADQALDFLESTIARYIERNDLEMNPDFQRGHVWNEVRQIAFVEHLLRGGVGSNEIWFNCPGWMADFRGPFQLVDGLQRLTACLRFLRNEIPVFDHSYSEYEDSMGLSRCGLVFRINDLDSRAQVLRWYLEINSGGVVHTKSELARVRHLLEKEERV